MYKAFVGASAFTVLMASFYSVAKIQPVAVSVTCTIDLLIAGTIQLMQA